ncbi:hypothetical protein PCANC_22547 [Puccinia coronata f. sp. avenae]|uniref:Uncharacterized protein n=1 Tax=Puccinia coronata f. sp. avenae TaxID=200324 RepID=A0A2N5SBW1_9BASI|nr:hypothetical protein PCANC_22547 [Puccinia coronata f. sp. avenae]
MIYTAKIPHFVNRGLEKIQLSNADSRVLEAWKPLTLVSYKAAVKKYANFKESRGELRYTLPITPPKLYAFVAWAGRGHEDDGSTKISPGSLTKYLFAIKSWHTSLPKGLCQLTQSAVTSDILSRCYIGPSIRCNGAPMLHRPGLMLHRRCLTVNSAVAMQDHLMSPRRNPLAMLRRRDGNRHDGQPIHHQPNAMMYRLVASQWLTQYQRRRFYIGAGDPLPVLPDAISGLVDTTSGLLDATPGLLNTTPAPLDATSVVVDTTSLLPDATTAWLATSAVWPNATLDTRTDTTP